MFYENTPNSESKNTIFLAFAQPVVFGILLPLARRQDCNFWLPANRGLMEDQSIMAGEECYYYFLLN